MKKVLFLLAAVLLTFTACKKQPKPTPDPKPDDKPESDELIIIDGNFDDWATASGVITVKNNSDYVGVEVDESRQRVDALKVMKIAADKYNIYVYTEVDMSVIYRGGVPNWEGTIMDPAKAMALEVYIDADNNPATGGINWVWGTCGWEYHLEASVFSDQASAYGELEGGDFTKFTGEDGTDIWAVDPPAQESMTDNGLFAGNGKLDGNTAKYEVCITRALLPKLGKSCAIGVEILSENWMLMGVLPQCNDAEGTWAGKLEPITLP